MAQSEIQKLIKALMSDDEQVREAALFAQALKDKDEDVRREAAKALKKLQGKE